MRISRKPYAALVAAGALTATLAVAGSTGSASAQPTAGPVQPTVTTSCQLGNGVQHVVNIIFDNVHFFRDNPNVPSDLEQMPHLLNFLESNGTVFSNTHTPLIAHTADDSLTVYTGLYGDRHGQPLTNSYKTYNPNGSTDPATSFAYWTSPVADTASSPTAGHDTTPSMAYSASVPAHGPANQITPAPWVPFTRAGCDVGDFSTANMVLENAKVDIPTVFGAGSPEVTQLNTDSDSFKDPEVADYIGEAVHCAQGSALCANATAIKNGQTTASPSAVTDALPTEPGGYTGYQGLFGHRYIAPVLGAGTPNVTRNGYQVTNAAGNLVDENGNQINGAFLNNHPGFPGFSPTAPQSLAMIADMQESGIPITYGYISDLHERKAGTSGCTTAGATASGRPLGPGDTCYVNNAKAYDQAFATFFQRLAADGITPANTIFEIGAEENDQLAGANVGRATQPTPAGCDGVNTPCNYTTSQVGELQANIKGLLSTTPSASTQFDIEPQGASIYVHGQPAANDPTVRQLERDTAAMTGNNPYTGNPNEQIVKYQAGATEERILHMQTADSLRMPTYTLFPMPDYFFATSGANVSINNAFAWDHGYYSPNIDIIWSSFVGPGVAHKGVDGPSPTGGNEQHDPNSTNTVPQASQQGTWVEEADIRPTELYLLGLHDDYVNDGAVVQEALASQPSTFTKQDELAGTYVQLYSSVGAFGTDTLLAESAALAGSDATYNRVEATLARLADQRDALATQMKATLAQYSAGQTPSLATVINEIGQAQGLLAQAKALARSVR